MDSRFHIIGIFIVSGIPDSISKLQFFKKFQYELFVKRDSIANATFYRRDSYCIGLRFLLQIFVPLELNLGTYLMAKALNKLLIDGSFYLSAAL